MKTKALIIFLIISNLVLTLSAQKKDKRYHSFGSERIWHSKIYVGPLAVVSNVEGVLSLDLGATGGFIYRNKFIMGLYGQKMVTTHTRTEFYISGYPDITEGEVTLKHAGAILGYIHNPEALMHLGFSSSAGVGVLELLAKNPVSLNIEQAYNDRIFIVIPKIFAELNVTKWVKINASAGYRIFGKVNSQYTNQAGEQIPAFSQADYTKPEISLSLLFGTFGFRTASLF